MSNVKAQAVAVALLLGYATMPTHADAAQRPNVEIGHVTADQDITWRRAAATAR